jgi:CheY-like chemotaxis protein
MHLFGGPAVFRCREREEAVRLPVGSDGGAEAGNADEAIRVLELHAEIRFVFTDVNMPGSMNGLKLAHYIRGRWPPVKIIIASGHVHLRDEDLPAGAVFVKKPYHLRHITSTLREI